MRTFSTLMLTLVLATGALAATLGFDQFAGRVGRNAVLLGDAPKDLCVCTDVGTMQNKAGYLVRSSVVWNGGLYVPVSCFVQRFDPADGGTIGAGFLVLGR
jgi:hypothetical protein